MASLLITDPILVCRPALAQDTPAMWEITRTTFDGHDYVPHEWDQWLREASGCLAVVELGGKVVGLARLTRFGERDWWNQALRVHPDFRGQGVASHLNKYLFERWMQIGSGTLRFTTTADRYPVQHLAEQTGFVRVGEFTAFIAPAIKEQPDQFTLISREQSGDALDFIQQSPLLDWQYGLLNWGWEWTTPELQWIQKAIEKRHAWWWKDGQGLILAYVDKDDQVNEESLAVELLAGTPETAVDMLVDFRRLAAGEGYADALWTASLQDRLAPVLAQAGYIRAWDNSVYLYAIKHS
ncbi:MAG TPA: GNAT family N-acetyltransferase [Anaerolineales bacterium]|nr:GNAT family N-acetyltransferase [Anaerolineales bacterium]